MNIRLQSWETTLPLREWARRFKREAPFPYVAHRASDRNTVSNHLTSSSVENLLPQQSAIELQ